MLASRMPPWAGSNRLDLTGMNEPLPSIQDEGLFLFMVPISESSATAVNTVLASSKDNPKTRAAWDRILQKNMYHIESQDENFSKSGKSIFVSDNERRPFQFSTVGQMDAEIEENGNGGTRRDRTMENTRIFPSLDDSDGFIQPSDIMKKEHCNLSLLNSNLNWALRKSEELRPISIYNAKGISNNVDEIDR